MKVMNFVAFIMCLTAAIMHAYLHNIGWCVVLSMLSVLNAIIFMLQE